MRNGHRSTPTAAVVTGAAGWLGQNLVRALAAQSGRVFNEFVRHNLFMLGLPPEVPEHTGNVISQIIALGMPAAVFVGPSRYGT
jgi:hypothetical protein